MNWAKINWRYDLENSPRCYIGKYTKYEQTVDTLAARALGPPRVSIVPADAGVPQRHFISKIEAA